MKTKYKRQGPFNLCFFFLKVKGLVYAHNSLCTHDIWTLSTLYLIEFFWVRVWENNMYTHASCTLLSERFLFILYWKINTIKKHHEKQKKKSSIYYMHACLPSCIHTVHANCVVRSRGLCNINTMLLIKWKTIMV